jgi:hypothetical protein
VAMEKFTCTWIGFCPQPLPGPRRIQFLHGTSAFISGLASHGHRSRHRLDPWSRLMDTKHPPKTTAPAPDAHVSGPLSLQVSSSSYLWLVPMSGGITQRGIYSATSNSLEQWIWLTSSLFLKPNWPMENYFKNKIIPFWMESWDL